jgi:hypothetical protein
MVGLYETNGYPFIGDHLHIGSEEREWKINKLKKVDKDAIAALKCQAVSERRQNSV